MFNFTNHMYVSKNLNEGYDYISNLTLFSRVLNNLAHDDRARQLSSMSVLDAVLCVDMSCTPNDADTVTQTALDIIKRNEYHPQYKVASFAALVLYEYAHEENKTLREAFCDFIIYGVFDHLYYYYVVLHTQTIEYAAQSAKNVIGIRSDVRTRHAIEDNVPDLAFLMPSVRSYEHGISTNFKWKAEEMQMMEGASFPLEAAVLGVIRSATEDVPVEDVLARVPADDSAVECERQMKRVFDAFAAAHAEDGVSWHEWMMDAVNTGLVFLLASLSNADDRKKVLEAFDTEHQALREQRAETSKRIRETNGKYQKLRASSVASS